MLKKVMAVKSASSIGLFIVLLSGLPAQGQSIRENPWAYTPEQHRSDGQRPWGQTPSSTRDSTRYQFDNQRPQRNSQPCQSNEYYAPHPNQGLAPGYGGFSDPYLGMPYGLPGGGWTNPLYPVDPYMGLH
jgi:hypothetical protein